MNPRALVALLAMSTILTACGSDAGAEACTAYQETLEDDPLALASTFVLPEIKDKLSDMDDLTRRAFAGLITAADADTFSPGKADAVIAAAAEVRATCLSEHGVEIPS